MYCIFDIFFDYIPNTDPEDFIKSYKNAFISSLMKLNNISLEDIELSWNLYAGNSLSIISKLYNDKYHKLEQLYEDCKKEKEELKEADKKIEENDQLHKKNMIQIAKNVKHATACGLTGEFCCFCMNIKTGLVTMTKCACGYQFCRECSKKANNYYTRAFTCIECQKKYICNNCINFCDNEPHMVCIECSSHHDCSNNIYKTVLSKQDMYSISDDEKFLIYRAICDLQINLEISSDEIIFKYNKVIENYPCSGLWGSNPPLSNIKYIVMGLTHMSELNFEESYLHKLCESLHKKYTESFI